MQERSVDEWVDYIQTLHHREIELGLDRVREVYKRLYPDGLSCKIISVAGTNGKGSTAELLSSTYHVAGYKVGKFTSPHLMNFTERYVINGRPVDEPALLAALEKIESVRGNIAITFFEFGTLLAIELFAKADVDIAIMEVGLGGRLDAVNILDADISIITSISLDHISWLGDTVEKIGFEKAGIAREGKPCLVGIEQPPLSIIDHCAQIRSPLMAIEHDFSYQHYGHDKRWAWAGAHTRLDDLPLPYGQTGVQLSNAALSLMAVRLLDNVLPVSEQSVRRGLECAELLARCQVLSQQPLIVLDVAHNEASTHRLTSFLQRQEIIGKTIAVCGMLKDKEVAKSLANLKPLVDKWHFASIDNERGCSSQQLANEFQTLKPAANRDNIVLYSGIEQAFVDARKQLTAHDCLVVFGSFFVAGDILSLV